MSLNQKLINELNDILREDCGKELSQKELFEVVTTLISYFDLLAKIYYRNKLEEQSCERNNLK